MKYAVPLLAACLLSTSACSSSGGPESDPSTAAVESSAVPAPTTSQRSLPIAIVEERPELCARLLEDDGGLFVETSDFLVEVNEISADNADRAGKLSMRLGLLALSTDAEMAPLIRGMQKPFEDYVRAVDDGTSWSLDGPAFKSAANELASICSDYPSARTAPEPAPTADFLPPPTPVPVAPAPVAPPAPVPTLSETVSQANARRAAENYMNVLPFSRTGLTEQLINYDKFLPDDAAYAVDNVVVDWNEQAAKSAKNYLDVLPYSRSELVQQLIDYEGFTPEQAEYGVSQTGL